MKPLVTVVQRSNNSKIAPKGQEVSATYVSQKTCPNTCPLKGNGCYAEKGRTAFTLRRLEALTEELNASRLDLAEAEAIGIDDLKAKGQDLRIHVVGDCATNEAARIVSAAADRFASRGGGVPWTYTHSWRSVLRSSWGGVSVLASMHNLWEGRRAIKKGYAPAVVVEEFPDEHRYFESHEVRWIPCREQTQGVTCVDCRLCFKADTLRDRGLGIAFAKH